MNERVAVMVGAAVGAAVGALAGFLFLTERGRRVRQELEPKLEVLLRDAARFGDTLQRARDVAAEGWRAARTETGEWPAGSEQQRAPF